MNKFVIILLVLFITVWVGASIMVAAANRNLEEDDDGVAIFRSEE